MKDFFISYTKADRNWAEWIAWQLEENGYQVVIQAWDFRPGGNFVLDMQKAAAECERTIAVLSPDFLKSVFTQPEWAASFSQDPTGDKGLLVPVRVKECELTGLLRQIVYIDLVGLSERTAIEKLLNGILLGRNKPTHSPTFPGESSGRAVPTLPPFPQSLPMPANEPVDPREMVEYLPHPIAAALAAFEQSSDEKERFVALDNVLKNTVNYLAAVALSQYWQDKPDKKKLRLWLRDLITTHLLTSLQILDKVGAQYKPLLQKPYIYPALFERYFTPLDADSAIGKAWNALSRIERRQGTPVPETINPQIFLQLWLTTRQSRWEADPQKIEPSLRKKLLPLLRSALLQLLTLFTPFFSYGLRYIERVDHDGEAWVYTMVEFPGVDGKAAVLPTALRESNAEQPTFKDKRLYLCSAQDYPLVCLHPLLISHLYNLYFLEYVGEDNTLWYRHCSSSDRYYPPDYYHYLSTSFREDAEARPEGDPVADLKKASEELDKAEASERIDGMPIPVIMSHLDDSAREVLEIGLGESLRIGQCWLGIEFLLMGLSKQKDSLLARKLKEIGVDGRKLRGALRGFVGVKSEGWQEKVDVQGLGADAVAELQEIDMPRLAEQYSLGNLSRPVVTPRMLKVLREAVHLADGRRVTATDLLLAALRHHQSLAVSILLSLVAETKQDPENWVTQLIQEAEHPKAGHARRAPDIKNGMPQPPDQISEKGVLKRIGRDLTALAQKDLLRPAIGESAHKAMVQIGLILQQTEANNPILISDPGVGKTAIIEGFAWRLANDKDVIAKLAEKRIVDISANSLLAGTKYRGDLEERLQELLKEVCSAQGQIIVFIDEIHTILGGRAEGGLGALSDVLKPALSRGEFPCIGATTVSEYRRYIESDPALARRFTPVWLEEPSPEEALMIAKEVARQHLAPSHRVEYPDHVIAEAVRLSVRYLHDEFLPGKVIKLLDQAGPRVTMGGSLRGLPADKDQSIGGVVTMEMVRQIVSERTGIPLTSLSEDERAKLLNLESKLRLRVKGQDEAVNQVVKVVKRSRSGLADPRRPSGVFLFAGPTGVGKTELALALAEALFDDENAILRLDMSEYLEMHQVSRLIGSPPGYVGHGEEGQLTGHLRRRPYSVVLLDEMEKAHKDVQHLFLQLFDAGRLTDSRGHVVDGRNAIFIMTTNLGAKESMGLISELKSYEEKLQAAIEEYFSAEFLNRIDRIVYFKPLTEELLLAIFDKFFAQAVERFRAQNIEVEVTDSFKRDLCRRYADVKRGARPLQRAIEDEIVAPLTDQLISGEIKAGMKVVIGERS